MDERLPTEEQRAQAEAEYNRLSLIADRCPECGEPCVATTMVEWVQKLLEHKCPT